MEIAEVRITSGSPTRCPFCHDALEPISEKWIACGACLARHHADCWDETAACASCKFSTPLAPTAPGKIRIVLPPTSVHRRLDRRRRAKFRRWVVGMTVAVSLLWNGIALVHFVAGERERLAPFIFSIF